MRVQPPKNIEKFVGKKATKKRTIEYIGSHRLLLNDGETTIQEYLESLKSFTEKDVLPFMSMFLNEIQNLALMYLTDFQIKKHKKHVKK